MTRNPRSDPAERGSRARAAARLDATAPEVATRARGGAARLRVEVTHLIGDRTRARGPAAIAARHLGGMVRLSVGMVRLSVGMVLLPVGMVLLPVGMVRLSVGMVRLSVGMVPLSVGMVPLSVGMVPLSVGMVPLSVEMVPLPVGMVPLPVGMARPFVGTGLRRAEGLVAHPPVPRRRCRATPGRVTMTPRSRSR